MSPFHTNAVDYRDVDSVSNRMCPLNRLPGIMLGHTELSLLRRMPADRRGIENEICALQCSQPRTFRVPLVPAYQRAYASNASVEGFESEIPGVK